MAQTLDMQQAQRAIDTIRLLSADMVEQAQSGHPGTPMEAAPIAYLLYNKYMGGVDLMDQYMAKFPVGFKVRRWYMRVFYWLLNLASVTVLIYIKIRGGDFLSFSELFERDGME